MERGRASENVNYELIRRLLLLLACKCSSNVARDDASFIWVTAPAILNEEASAAADADSTRSHVRESRFRHASRCNVLRCRSARRYEKLSRTRAAFSWDKERKLGRERERGSSESAIEIHRLQYIPQGERDVFRVKSCSSSFAVGTV